MSSSDSDSDIDKITDWPYRCTCNCGATDCSDVSDSDNYDIESEESFSEVSSSEESTNAKKIIFISIFNHKTQKNKNLISDAVEIENYREKYQKLPFKNDKTIKSIWADVKIDMPVLGQIPLKRIDNDLNADTTTNGNNKKKFKKPTHLMQKNLSPDSSASNSEQSVIANKCVMQPKIKQANRQLSQAQIEKENSKILEIKNANEVISKVNVAPKNISNNNQNKNPKNEANILEKLNKPVNDKSVKPQITKDNLKSNAGKIVNTNNNISNIQSVAENNTKKISNVSNQKSSIGNNSAKANVVKTSVKVITENKTEKNEETKKKSSVASPLPEKESKEEPEIKTNAENKVEKSNLVKQNIKSNTENKMQKTDSINSNMGSGAKDKTSNNNLNNEKLKSETALFKIPASDNIILSSNNNKKENTTNDKNLQSNKNDTVKKLSKKQEKKRRQKERKLEANNRDTSTSSSRDVSLSSPNSCNDKNFKNNSNKNVKDKVDKPRNEKVTKSEKNIPENKKVAESKNSEQDTEESEIEEMNTINDDLDLLTDAEHLPTFIADIVKRKEKNKQIKTKPVIGTPTKNKDKKNREQEKIKVENEQEFIVNTRKRKLAPVTDKNYIIYSDRYAEESVEMMLENNFMGALECITIAIDYNPSDYRHYLNRSYCYLRMNQPAYALTDAQYVIHLCTNIGHIFIANLRAGQAAYALRNYKQAEYFLKEATHINPENYHAQRELIRVKLSHIVSLGFKEKDALMALQQYPSTLEAIRFLNKDKKNSSISKFADDFNIYDCNFDDMVFASDDDEEESSNFQTLNRMLNYQPGKVKIQHLMSKPVKSELLLGSNNCDKNSKPKITPDVRKKLVPTNKCTYNDKAIWVGNLTNNINEQMLKKKFKQFGNIVSIYRPCNEAYAFINFEKIEDVTNTLINTNAHEIAGVKLTVRSAVRQK